MPSAFDASKHARAMAPVDGDRAIRVQNADAAAVTSESSNPEKDVVNAAKRHSRSAFSRSTKWMIVVFSSYAGIFS
jgi:hypothetical protein